MSNDLFELRNYFLLGNYQAAINAGISLTNNSSKLQPNDQVERDCYIYRSYIAQGNHKFVLQEIKESVQAPALQAVRLLAVYHLSPDSREKILATLKQWSADGVLNNNPTAQIIASTIYYLEENFEEAMRSVIQSQSIEALALLIQIYLKINRIDLAEKELKHLQQIDDDATGTLLATAWVDISLGGEKLTEAFSIFSDLTEKYGASSKLLNGKAVCSLHARNFPEAEKFLLQALEKNSNDVDTQINLVACYQHQDKPQDMIARQINQVKSLSPNHPWLKSIQQLEDNFDVLAQKFST